MSAQIATLQRAYVQFSSGEILGKSAWAHLDEGLGEAGALSVIALCINCLLLNLHALIMHMIAMVVLMPISDFQLGPAQAKVFSQEFSESVIEMPPSTRWT